MNFSSAAFYTMIIAAAYAGLDEYHQSFVPGRTAELKDVFIDSLGIIAGVGVYRVLLFFFAYLR